MAIAAMGVSARLLASLLELPRVAGADDCLAWSHGREPPACVLDVTAAIDGPSTDVVGQAIRRLPQDWSVTSDSIAAAVAVALDATHLHLLKSADPPGSATLNELARLRFVDGHLPRFAGQLNLHVTNLRRRA